MEPATDPPQRNRPPTPLSLQPFWKKQSCRFGTTAGSQTLFVDTSKVQLPVLTNCCCHHFSKQMSRPLDLVLSSDQPKVAVAIQSTASMSRLWPSCAPAALRMPWRNRLGRTAPAHLPAACRCVRSPTHASRGFGSTPDRRQGTHDGQRLLRAHRRKLFAEPTYLSRISQRAKCARRSMRHSVVRYGDLPRRRPLRGMTAEKGQRPSLRGAERRSNPQAVVACWIASLRSQ